MMQRCCAIFLLLHLIGKVSLQASANITSFVGDTIILPCQIQPGITDVLWRHNVSWKVLNVIDGKPSIEEQFDIFKNRAESFPSEYAKGNYSVMLKDVEFDHAGRYTCFFPELNVEKLVELLVKEKPTEPISKPTIKDTETQKATNSSVKALKILTFQIALLALTLHLTVCEFDF
ncbi:uncharacterized protein LOC570464 precursor [Danio rerio]|uniref:Uncharacterized protein LOC570464 precursor n=1 Tax=Danio rerio TaxID=7955 RepID=A4JYP9_DANRE|nr:uncharacterized protein LOC570464 precursor [Danio rerio]CAM73231.1 wu:fu71h07 [Danio rerio]|eukprot:NP_001077321.1 uncharacterized protein LOC570464 precursor [Danio rerio]